MGFKFDKAFLRNSLYLLLLSGFIFTLGFGVRADMLKYDYIFEFDSYYRARIVKLLLQNDGLLPAQDPGNFAPGLDTGHARLVELIGYNLYKLLYGSEYDQGKWLLDKLALAKLLPAVFGALTAVALFFFMREVSGNFGG
ncbi:MAG TPA: hypothetical protein VJI67_03705, partial [archaeon]|nr:hypothetical protein [archaeon]